MVRQAQERDLRLYYLPGQQLWGQCSGHFERKLLKK
jgi:hypothetical protein